METKPSFDDLEFAPIAPAAANAGPTVRVAVLKSDALRITFNAAAYEKLDKPSRMFVAAASRDDFHFLSVRPAGEAELQALVVVQRAPTKKSRPGASITVHAHPFEPGVTHGATDVETTWRDDGSAVLQMPDWNEILGSIKGDEEDPS